MVILLVKKTRSITGENHQPVIDKFTVVSSTPRHTTLLVVSTNQQTSGDSLFSFNQDRGTESAEFAMSGVCTYCIGR